MWNRATKVWLAAMLLIGIVCVMHHQTNAGSLEPCATADQGQPAGGCRGCWVIFSGTMWDSGMPEPFTLQARCNDETGDGMCPTKWMTGIPSDACYGETTSCPAGTKYYLSSNTEASGDAECGLQLSVTTCGDAEHYVRDNEGGHTFDDPNDPNDNPYDHLDYVPDYTTAKRSCNNSYWKVTDTTANVNCTGP